MNTNDGTMVLYHPQWQGCGNDDALLHGAAALRHGLYFQSGINFIDIDPNANLTEDDLADLGLDDSSPPITNLGALIANNNQVIETLISCNPRRIFTLGGDCGVSLAPVSWLHNKWDNFALLYLDAHADLNTPASSPSGNFHGMVLRNLLEGRNVEQTWAFRGLRPEQVVLLGTRDLDPPEAEYIAEQNLTVVSVEDLATQGSGSVLQILRSRGLTKVYVHIDVDVLGPENFAYSFMKVPNGVPIDAVRGLLSDLRASGDIEIVGGSMTEVNGGSEPDKLAMEDMCKLFALLRGLAP